MSTALTFWYMVIAWATCAAMFVILLGELIEHRQRVKAPRASAAIALVLLVLVSVLLGMLWPLYHLVTMTAQAAAAGKKCEKGDGE